MTFIERRHLVSSSAEYPTRLTLPPPPPSEEAEEAIPFASSVLASHAAMAAVRAPGFLPASPPSSPCPGAFERAAAAFCSASSVVRCSSSSWMSRCRGSRSFCTQGEGTEDKEGRLIQPPPQTHISAHAPTHSCPHLEPLESLLQHPPLTHTLPHIVCPHLEPLESLLQHPHTSLEAC